MIINSFWNIGPSVIWSRQPYTGLLGQIFHCKIGVFESDVDESNEFFKDNKKRVWIMNWIKSTPWTFRKLMVETKSTGFAMSFLYESQIWDWGLEGRNYVSTYGATRVEISRLTSIKSIYDIFLDYQTSREGKKINGSPIDYFLISFRFSIETLNKNSSCFFLKKVFEYRDQLKKKSLFGIFGTSGFWGKNKMKDFLFEFSCTNHKVSLERWMKENEFCSNWMKEFGHQDKFIQLALFWKFQSIRILMYGTKWWIFLGNSALFVRTVPLKHWRKKTGKQAGHRKRRVWIASKNLWSEQFLECLCSQDSGARK